MTAAQYKSAGVAAPHAYSLLHAERLDDGTALLQLRNPWGQGEPATAWSDSDPRWTEALREKLHAAEKDDGVFWMALPDLRRCGMRGAVAPRPVVRA